jgi:Glycerophosphoryl diester phosphodiesterase family
MHHHSTYRFRLSTLPVIVICGFVTGHFQAVFAQSPANERPALLQAHAHNDYLHSRPLLDALDQGFTSIEADIFLVDGQLLVAHYLKDVKPERTLQKLYLDPLYQRFKQNSGKLFPNNERLTLLIDIKNQGEQTYLLLSQQLEAYRDMLSSTRDGQHTSRQVTIIISGDRPIEAIKSSNPCYVGIDGRLTDLDSDAPSWLYPLISDNWYRHFQYRGAGEFSSDEKKRLKNIVEQAHARGRRVRFWATPESESVWQELQSSGVDLIGTDDLERLAKFLRSSN